MKVTALNASPRKKWNTASLLEQALKGAEDAGAQTEFIHLTDLNYSGCISCFGCKRLGADNETTRFCAVKDDLTDVLHKIMDSDVVLLGSPIYINDVTGLFRNLIERLAFMNISYGKYRDMPFEGKISAGLFYTTNAPAEAVEKMYYPIFENHQALFKRLFGGDCEIYAATETYQFEDYSKYDTSALNPEGRRKRREEQWPLDLQKAYEIGRSLTESY